MNEFVAHVMAKLDTHEASIRKLIKKNKNTCLAVAILAGVSIYHTMKISDLQFEVLQLQKKVDEKESSVVNNYTNL